MKFINSLEKPNMRSETLIGIMAQTNSVYFIIFMTRAKRLISLPCFSSSSVGKRLVQNCVRVKSSL